MNFYQSLGYLVFGSRLRRLSEAFLSDINKVYHKHKIEFDASWFPVFYILSRKDEVNIKDIADEIGVSHSAISQLVGNLQEKGLIKSAVSKKDGRKKTISFTVKGNKLLTKIEPLWDALQKAMEALADEGKRSPTILDSLNELEAHIQEQTIFERVEAIMHKTNKP